jgi:hypothetical protein
MFSGLGDKDPSELVDGALGYSGIEEPEKHPRLFGDMFALDNFCCRSSHSWWGYATIQLSRLVRIRRMS